MSANTAIQKIGPDDSRMAAAMQKMEGLLVPGERLMAHAKQGRVPAYMRGQRRGLLAATNNRVICIRRGLIAGFKMQDLQWQDVLDARIEERILGSTITIRSNYAPTVVIDGLEKADAQAVYRLCQQQEQVWREKNRVRAMEEARGGYATHANVMSAPMALPAASQTQDPTLKLAQAKGMLDQGLISADEYEAIKAKIFTNF